MVADYNFNETGRKKSFNLFLKLYLIDALLFEQIELLKY